MLSLFSLPMALLLDHFLGEPKRFHPLVWFGSKVDQLEQELNVGTRLFWRGALAWCLLVLPLVITVFCLDYLLGGWWMSILCGWLALGWNSLRQHGRWIYQALEQGDLTEARTKLSWIVSRDTHDLNPQHISRASIESILENGSDAIFAPLFWLAIAGAPGVILYRLSNTLDAMWGYRNERFEQFGKFSARMDDVLNYIPARLTALTYALVGNFRVAMQSWRLQGAHWYSPNAGVVMASGAGALQVSLGGGAIYHGEYKERPTLGIGLEPDARDIARALRLVDKGVVIWLVVTVVTMVLSLLL